MCPTQLVEKGGQSQNLTKGILQLFQNKKRNSSNNNSLQRDEIMVRYFGKSLKGNFFTKQIKNKANNMSKLHRSFHYQKPRFGSQVPTPKLK